jgi:hypothetical protein
MPSSEKLIYALAIDIESIGPHHSQVVQIGLAVVSKHPRYALVDRFSAASYHPEFDGDNFEERCKRELWDKHPKKLDALAKATDQDRTKDDTMHSMISGAMRFITKWMCEQTEATVHFATDNPAYDVGLLNGLILKHLSTRYYQLPYFGELGDESSPPKYLAIYDTGSMQKMSLMQRDFSKNVSMCFGTTSAIKELEGIGQYPVNHDHDAVNDAYHIGCEYQTLLYRSTRISAWKKALTYIAWGSVAIAPWISFVSRWDSWIVYAPCAFATTLYFIVAK